MLGHLSGVIIWTGDLPALREFYCETLGMRPHSDRPHFVSFKWGGLRFAIGSHDRVSSAARDPHRVMVNFDATDIHALHAELTAKGVEFIRPPERESWGGWVASFLDPDGNIIQLLEQPPERRGDRGLGGRRGLARHSGSAGARRTLTLALSHEGRGDPLGAVCA